MFALVCCLIFLVGHAYAAGHVSLDNSTPQAVVLESLPTELLIQILGYLREWHLRSVLRVSRALNAAAHKAGLRLTRRVSYPPANGRGDSVEPLARVVDHVARYNRPMNLAIVFDSTATDVSPGLDRAFAVIGTAMPFVVSLNITIAAQLIPNLPARFPLLGPRLRDLVVKDSTYPTTRPAPRAAFLCVRENVLSKVSLDIVTLDSRWICCTFPSVEDLELRMDYTGPFVDVRHYFPHLTRLLISARTVQIGAIISVPRSLRRLIVDEYKAKLTASYMASQIPLDRLTTFQRICMIADVSNITVPTPSGDLCGRIQIVNYCGTPGVAIAISLAGASGGDCRSSCVPDWSDGAELPIAGLRPAFGDHLVSLVLQSALCSTFLRTAISLNALKHLALELDHRDKGPNMWPPLGNVSDHGVRSRLYNLPEEQVRVCCPALQSLTLSWEFTITASVAVRPDRLARFGRALQFPQRPADERPSLRLVGCFFVGSPMFSGLDKSFSSIEEVPFDSARFPPFFDHCRWTGFPGARVVV